MGKSRLEAFSDGVIAIIITIMVLELKVPRGERIDALAPLIPVFLSYVLSFVYVGIYWNNHHHMLHTSSQGNRTDAVGQPASVVLAIACFPSPRVGWEKITSPQRHRPSMGSFC